MFVKVLFLLLSVRNVKSGRILAVMPTPSYSHQIVYNPLWLELNSRGHHITLLTTNLIENPNLKNFRQINWNFTYHLWHEKHNASNIIKNFNKNFIKCLNDYTEMMKDIFTQELDHSEISEIIQNDKFDLVIAEMLNPVMIGFSYVFQCPFIGVSPMDVTNFIHEAVNNPISPALYPDFLSPFDSKMDFLERIQNLFYYLGSKIYFKYFLYPEMDKISRRFFGDLPTLEEMQKNVSLMILNTNFLIHNVRPLMSNVLTIGGGVHIQKNTSMSQDIAEFLNRGNPGVIYFSLGTNVKSKDMDNNIKKTFLKVFYQLPYKVLWKLEDNTSGNNNTKILFRKWLPQQQILKHPNVKLFITQGGLQSLEEAIINEIPIIAIPTYIDQYSNVKNVIKKDIGIELNHQNLNAQTLIHAINETIKNPKYKTSVQKLSILLKDQPISGIDEAVWHIEYILKHKGAKFLKHKTIPLYQYLLIDVFVFFCLILLIIYYLILKTYKLLRRIAKNGLKIIKIE